MVINSLVLDEQLDRSEILRYLGYRGNEITETVEREIHEAIIIANQVSKIKVTWKLFNVSNTDEGIFLAGTECILKGKSIQKLLNNTDKAVLFCASLGADFDREVEKWMIKEPAKGVILNSCGITLIEKVCDTLQKEIDKIFENEKTGLRFSPGYGDLPLETQEDFIKLLNTEKTVGVRLNKNYLMNPAKSVTAIAGIIPKDTNPGDYTDY